MCKNQDTDPSGSYANTYVRSVSKLRRPAFIKGWTCLTKLVAFWDGMPELVNKGKLTDVIYVDLCKAFDATSLSLTRRDMDYLMNKQLFVVSSSVYRWRLVRSGALQGSVLWLELFNKRQGQVQGAAFGSGQSQICVQSRRTDWEKLQRRTLGLWWTKKSWTWKILNSCNLEETVEGHLIQLPCHEEKHLQTK